MWPIINHTTLIDGATCTDRSAGDGCFVSTSSCTGQRSGDVEPGEVWTIEIAASDDGLIDEIKFERASCISKQLLRSIADEGDSDGRSHVLDFRVWPRWRIQRVMRSAAFARGGNRLLAAVAFIINNKTGFTAECVAKCRSRVRDVPVFRIWRDGSDDGPEVMLTVHVKTIGHDRSRRYNKVLRAKLKIDFFRSFENSGRWWWWWWCWWFGWISNVWGDVMRKWSACLLNCTKHGVRRRQIPRSFYYVKRMHKIRK